MGFHLCLVGWLDNGTAGYPTAYPNPSCGANRVGIVDYGSRSNLSETWDAFCYREKGERHEHVSWGWSCGAQKDCWVSRRRSALGQRGTSPSPHACGRREHAEGYPEVKGKALGIGELSRILVFLCRSDLHLPGWVCG